jgi:hypothetical protein
MRECNKQANRHLFCSQPLVAEAEFMPEGGLLVAGSLLGALINYLAR